MGKINLRTIQLLLKTSKHEHQSSFNRTQKHQIKTLVLLVLTNLSTNYWLLILYRFHQLLEKIDVYLKTTFRNENFSLENGLNVEPSFSHKSCAFVESFTNHLEMTLFFKSHLGYPQPILLLFDRNHTILNHPIIIYTITCFKQVTDVLLIAQSLFLWDL